LNYYVKGRQVYNYYARKFDLILADKLNETLPPAPLQFVLSKEGTECLQSSMIADLANIHVNNRIGMPNFSRQSYANTSNKGRNA